MRVVWTRAALSDIDDIQTYIAQDSPLAAYQLVSDIYSRAIRLLGDAPLAGRIGRARGTRELVFADLPYIVVYRVTDSAEIIAVMHTAQQWPENFD